MTSFLLEHLKRLADDERGVTLVEYGVAISLAIIVGSGAIALLAGDVGATFGAIGASLPN